MFSVCLSDNDFCIYTQFCKGQLFRLNLRIILDSLAFLSYVHTAYWPILVQSSRVTLWEYIRVWAISWHRTPCCVRDFAAWLYRLPRSMCSAQVLCLGYFLCPWCFPFSMNLHGESLYLLNALIINLAFLLTPFFLFLPLPPLSQSISHLSTCSVVWLVMLLSLPCTPSWWFCPVCCIPSTYKSPWHLM